MTVQLGSLYVAGMIVDVILLVYMFLIYRKFKDMFAHLEFFVYHRALLVVSYLFAFFNGLFPYEVVIIIGNTSFVVGSAILLYTIRHLINIPQDLKVSFSLIGTFVMVYSFFALVIPSFTTRMVVFSFITLIQYGSFVYDYFQNKTATSKVFMPVAVVMVVLLISHGTRLLHSFFMNPKDINPMQGTALEALLLITLTTANIALCLVINIIFHKISVKQS